MNGEPVSNPYAQIREQATRLSQAGVCPTGARSCQVKLEALGIGKEVNLCTRPARRAARVGGPARYLVGLMAEAFSRIRAAGEPRAVKAASEF